MSASSPLHSRPSLRDRRYDSRHLRPRSRSRVASPQRVVELERLDSDPNMAHASRSSTPAQGLLRFPSLISSTGFAQPPNTAIPGAGGGGGGSNHSNPNIIDPSRSPLPADRRRGSLAARTSRHQRTHQSPSSKQRSSRSPMNPSTASAMEERGRALIAPPLSQSLQSSGDAGNSVGRGRLRGRGPQRQEEGKARRAASTRSKSLDAAEVGRGGATMAALSSSALHATLASSASHSGDDINNGVGTAGVLCMFPQFSAGSNPLRPAGGALESSADPNLGFNGGGTANTAATSPTNLLTNGLSKENCSHCKVEDEPLYLCPCGLARYCSTTCQRAHWSFHRTVCCNSVRAVELSCRHCDWCGLSTNALRKCGCGFAYYCDVHCQRADWPYHRLVCSTVTSEATVETVLGCPSSRTTREAATQTAHWQIHVPVLRSSVHSETVPDSHSASGHGSASRPANQQYASIGCDSFAEARSSDGNNVANGSSSTRSSRTLPPQWENNSQLPGTSVFSDAHLPNNRSSSTTTTGHAGIAGHADPAYRLSTTSVGSGISPCSPSGRHSHNTYHRPSSLRESLHLTSSQKEPPSPNTHFRSDTEASPTVNKGTGHSSAGLVKHTTMSGIIVGPGNRHSYGMSEAERGGDGVGNSNTMSHSSVLAPVRDQPSLLAFAATSQRKIEGDEQKERGELRRQFQLERIGIEWKLLPKREEEQRMAILKEEVMWCVVTGYPTARNLKQQVRQMNKK
ncbi:hypothetical protein ABL78_1009 [Leptomonas seymouri]|uniref:MYND-type domain-containing protein n=1 Tax=Leptomonas seymouri TaxID=5684 RepID=A0A0N1IMA3_LEPSE|nr:hypothetical protein ABL78_1009 [Leptomonas seymouri]|eukprot:KPI89840.1 hypothetical protein ABL78_1009 [Leptomonas seymouri]